MSALSRRALLAGGFGLLAGCASVPQAASRPPLRIAARPDVLEAGPIWHAAEALGPGRVILSGGGVPNLIAGPAAAALDRFEGLADVAGQSETQLLRLSVANPELRIVLTITEGLYRIVARRSAGVARLADLAGKRIGVFERTSAAFFVHCMLRRAGLSEADAALVPLRYAEMAAAIQARRVDAIAIWEPESERAVQALGADAVTFADPSAYRELYNLNTTAAVLADPGRRAALLYLVRALRTSCRVSAEQPRAVWPLVAQRSDFDPALIAASWPHHRFPASLPADMIDVLVAEEAWLAAGEGRTPRPRAALERLIDPSILAEALA